MTVSKSYPPGPTSRTARSPRRRRALPPLQSSGGSLHYRGSKVGAARVHRDPSRLCRQQLRRAGSAESRKSGSRPRGCSVLSILVLPRLRVVCVPAHVFVRAYVCAPTRMCPHTHACSYLLSEAATAAMAAKDAEPDDRHPHGGTAQP